MFTRTGYKKKRKEKNLLRRNHSKNVSIECLNIEGTHVAANNSTKNNVLFIFVSDWKIVYYNNLFFESGFIYQFWKTTAPNILTGRRIQNWESTPSHDDDGGLSRRDHSEGVSRNKIRYEVVGR